MSFSRSCQPPQSAGARPACQREPAPRARLPRPPKERRCGTGEPRARAGGSARPLGAPRRRRELAATASSPTRTPAELSKPPGGAEALKAPLRAVPLRDAVRRRVQARAGVTDRLCSLATSAPRAESAHASAWLAGRTQHGCAAHLMWLRTRSTPTSGARLSCMRIRLCWPAVPPHTYPHEYKPRSQPAKPSWQPSQQ